MKGASATLVLCYPGDWGVKPYAGLSPIPGVGEPVALLQLEGTQSWLPVWMRFGSVIWEFAANMALEATPHFADTVVNVSPAWMV